jgi:hypothetical protein
VKYVDGFDIVSFSCIEIPGVCSLIGILFFRCAK